MANCVFLFDIIVVGIDTPTQTFPNVNQLVVQVNFNNLAIQITANGQNAVEFQAGRHLEFTDNPDLLKRTLDKCGLPVVLRYNGFTVANGTMKWPMEIIQQISADMTDLTHVGQVELTKGADRIGNMDMLCRLVVKCKVEENPSNDDKRRLEETINPRDVLFVVGQEHKNPNPCDPCVNLDEE